ncbi:MAG: PP2C family protein-serine/threonine phosphatase [Thermoanaerobaculia bacterium]
MSAETPFRLLVVDDNEMNRDVLARRLRKQAHDVAVAEDGHAALAALKGGGFDLVLLDVMMPGLGGPEVLAAMKADESLRHVPVIMISASEEMETVVRCIELGAEDYLPKPFNPTLLKARVDASLEKKRLRDREQRHAQSLERDLEIGRQIQATFFPERLPERPGWEIAARFEPARQCAGDFYDAFDLPGGRIALVVADVCDKGVGAALFMALFRTLLRASAGEAGDSRKEAPEATLEKTIRLTNDYIAVTHSRANMFATVFFAILDPATGEFSYVNAGHEPPLLFGPDRAVRELAPTGPALGLFASSVFGISRDGLGPGECLLAYTDGVTDAKGPEGFFSKERLLALIEGPVESASALVDGIADAVKRHTGERDRFDDVTLLAAFRRGPSGAGKSGR